MSTYEQLFEQSIRDPETFWTRQAGAIYWEQPWDKVLDRDRAPFSAWFVGGRTNLCYNAVDRHLTSRADQVALAWESTEVNTSRGYTYAELHDEVNRCAAILGSLGIAQGDRVIIYMPMIPEAVFAMLACARIGAIHSVVFGGFAPGSLAKRIDDASPKLVITADAGLRGGKVIPYTPLLQEALAQAKHPVEHVLRVNRGLLDEQPVPPDARYQTHDYAALRADLGNVHVPVAWLPAEHPSYVLYTSGTTGQPKGVQRDTGGYAVALAASMAMVYDAKPGEAMLTTSDIGWVVGHSYIVYGPLINGMTSILYEGLPVKPDGGIWWRLVEKYRVTTMFSSPTAIRVLKREDPACFSNADTSSLRILFLAGEPLDETTHQWISEALDRPVIDHYWQTESGWPMLAACAGLGVRETKLGSPAFPVPGYNLQIVDEALQPVPAGTKGKLVAQWPLPPGFMTTIWGDDERFVSQYFTRRGADWLYNTGDYAITDAQGYHFILGRDDDVINVAGHRLGTREIEETLCGVEGVVEAAVVGVRDELKGQAVCGYVVMGQQPIGDGEIASTSARLKQAVDQQLGAIARPARLYLVPQLPKTRSGKIMRRTILALTEGEPVGDISTMEDQAVLEMIKKALAEQRG